MQRMERSMENSRQSPEGETSVLKTGTVPLFSVSGRRMKETETKI